MKHKLFITIFFLSALSTAAEAKNSRATLELSVTEKGFEPESFGVKPGTEVILNVVRKTDTTCAKQIQVPARKMKADLPLNQPVKLTLGKLEKGELRFGCGMDMMAGGVISAK